LPTFSKRPESRSSGSMGKPNVRAGYCAFDLSFEEARALARRWREGALVKDCAERRESALRPMERSSSR
jgi:hypothetical protein